MQHRGSGSATVWTRYVYAHHPFDVVGWDGCLYPYVFSIHDFEPITGRLHQPPPVHQTFEGPNFVVCSFVPRLFDYHPDGIPAPYNHAQRRLRRGASSTRAATSCPASGAGIEQGSISLHPSGFTHGPQPGVGRGARSARRPPTSWRSWSTRSDRWTCCDPALACEDTSYAWTWAGRTIDPSADSTTG